VTASTSGDDQIGFPPHLTAEPITATEQRGIPEENRLREPGPVPEPGR
jgi:hypothetical protein